MTDSEFRAQFPPLVRDFARYKDVVQGCSPKTVTEYLFDLRTFCRWLTASRNGLPTEGEEFDAIGISDCDFEFMKTVTADEIYEYLSYLRFERGISP